jgi:hypothetical protein
MIYETSSRRSAIPKFPPAEVNRSDQKKKYQNSRKNRRPGRASGNPAGLSGGSFGFLLDAAPI